MEPNGYFDNAATSFPKPAEVAAAMARYLTEVGGSHRRSASPRAAEVARVVEAARDRVAALLGVGVPECVAFMPGATMAINTVMQSVLGRGGHVLISPLEHNAVMRPLTMLAQTCGVQFSLLPALADGTVDVDGIASAITPDTRLAVVNHESNVNGVIQPLRAIRQALGDIPLLVDASQSAGTVPVEMDAWGITFVAFTGHKALLGPPGTGGLAVCGNQRLDPLVLGGTGSLSDSFDMPSFMPDRLEAGTTNIAGLFGLRAALEHRPEPRHTRDDFMWLLGCVRALPGFTVHAALHADAQGALFSVSHARLDCADICTMLCERWGIEVRAGLHCAPLAHKTLGTFPRGTARIAPSPYHTRDDFARVVAALRSVAYT